jgi:hypothetical protein
MTRPLVQSVAAALATAACTGALATPPAGGPPAYALGTLLVWRVEVAAAVAAALYAAIVVIALAFEGQTISRLGPGGVDIPQRRRAAALDVWNDAEEIRQSIAERVPADPSSHESDSTKNQMSGERLRSEQKGA